MEGLENTLNALEAEPLPDDKPTLEMLIADHREFMENTSRRQNEVDRVCKARQIKSVKDTKKITKAKSPAPTYVHIHCRAFIPGPISLLAMINRGRVAEDRAHHESHRSLSEVDEILCDQRRVCNSLLELSDLVIRQLIIISPIDSCNWFPFELLAFMLKLLECMLRLMISKHFVSFSLLC